MPLTSSYIANVPQGNQQINNTQQPIENNFEDINDAFNVNHVPLNTTDTFGRHNFVTYYNQATTPSTSSTEMALYSQNSSSGVQLYYRYPSDGTVYPISQPYYYPTTGSGYISVCATYLETQSQYYFNGGILCQCFALQAVQDIALSGTFTYYFPQSYTYTPFFLSVSAGSISYSNNSGYPHSTGIVACAAISNEQFTVTIVNGTGALGSIMAMGI